MVTPAESQVIEIDKRLLSLMHQRVQVLHQVRKAFPFTFAVGELAG